MQPPISNAVNYSNNLSKTRDMDVHPTLYQELNCQFPSHPKQVVGVNVRARQSKQKQPRKGKSRFSFFGNTIFGSPF